MSAERRSQTAPAAECPQVTSLSIITEQPAQPCDPRDSNLIIEVGALRLPLGLELCDAKPLAHRKSESGSLLDGVGSNTVVSAPTLQHLLRKLVRTVESRKSKDALKPPA